MGQKDELGIVSGGMIFSTVTGPAPNGVGHFYCEPRRPSAAEKAGLEGCESDDVEKVRNSHARRVFLRLKRHARSKAVMAA